jgi:hypothetical protein
VLEGIKKLSRPIYCTVFLALFPREKLHGKIVFASLELAMI